MPATDTLSSTFNETRQHKGKVEEERKTIDTTKVNVNGMLVSRIVLLKARGCQYEDHQRNQLTKFIYYLLKIDVSLTKT